MTTTLSLDPRYDELTTSIHQIDALLDIITSTDITELKPMTLPNYFWVLIDILSKIKGICENLADVEVCLPSSCGGKNHAN